MSLPLPNRIPENCPDHLLALRIGDYQVGSWHPLPDGKGRATQVHLALRLNVGVVVLRLKSRNAVQTLIDALERHRDDVWPGGA